MKERYVHSLFVWDLAEDAADVHRRSVVLKERLAPRNKVWIVIGLDPLVYVLNHESWNICCVVILFMFLHPFLIFHG